MTDDWTRAPRVDARTNDAIVAQTEALLQSLTGGAWSPASAGAGLDPLGALVRVFADMAGQVVDGINEVPDAAFDAFLRLIGVEAQRPAPARVPLTFRLAAGAPVDAVVPAGTQVGATADEADPDPTPIVFETEEELVVSRARLLATLAHAPATDRLDVGPGTLRALAPQTPGVHELLVACPAILARAGAESWTLTLDFAAAPTGLDLTFHGDAGAGERELAASASIQSKRLTAALTAPPALVASKVSGREASWLSARLVPGLGRPPTLPALQKVTLAARFSGGGIAPKRVLRGATPVDATAEFYPFDSAPALGVACAFDGGDALAQPAGATVALDVVLGAAVDPDGSRPQATADLRVVWELLGGEGNWTELGRSSGSSPAILQNGQNPHSYLDETQAFTRPGRVRFVLPFTAPVNRHNGKEGRWVRARVVQGGYNEERAPLLGAVRLSYTHDIAAVVADRCLARDLGHVRDLGALDGSGGARVWTDLPEGAPALGDRPALYFGFDRAFEARAVRLFLDVLPPDPAQTEPPDELPPLADVPRVVWEYLGPRGWTGLGVRDGTDAMRQRGIVSFIGPPDLGVTALFGRSAAWLRARWVSGSYRADPRVATIALNTVWAMHASTRRGEVLGSGTGAPDQRFTLAAAPVLGEERVEVRERDQVGEREVAELRAALGDDAVIVERDASGAITAVWIRWTPVTHFHGSGPADRHYVLNPDTGAIQFGDGLAGRTPPRGRANVRAGLYRTGGGPRGDRPTGAVAQLKTAIAFVDGATNLVPASGGGARESDPRTRARGPKRLRHRGRAITAVDLEDLAFEAAQEVARAHAITTVFNPIDVGIDLSAEDAGQLDARGWIAGGAVPADTAAVAAQVAGVRVVIVPHSTADQPVPSLGLLEHVESYLRERSAPAMRLHVSGPRWIRVTVRAAVVPTADAPTDRLVSELRAAITRFLHPLTGGELGLGWDFGRIPRRSHIYRLLARTPGVRQISGLTVITDPPLPVGGETPSASQRRALTGGLVYSGAHELTLVGSDEEV